MRRCIADFVPTDKKLTVVVFGSRTNPKKMDEGMVHRALLEHLDFELIGVDIDDRLNVDVVMKQPYRVPLKSNSVDVVSSGQVFEHIPFFWASTMEIARLLKPGGLFILTVPSRVHPHYKVDCWRYYADGIRAMAAFAKLEVRRADTDFPPRREGPGRHYDLIDNVDTYGYWGDTVGVLQKPTNYPSLRMALVRTPLLLWANRASKSFVSTDELAAKERDRAKRRAKKQAERKRARERQRARKQERRRTRAEESDRRPPS